MHSVRTFFFMLFSVLPAAINAQPYVDIVTLQHISLKNSGITNNKTNAVAEGSWDLAMMNIPLQLDSFNMIIFSPGFEYRSVINDENRKDAFYRTAYLPITYLRTFRDGKNKLSLTGIYRYNADTRVAFGPKNDQVGVAVIYSHRQSERITYKTGLYFNQEFFHNQWIPFLGVDWHISNKLMLFSLLPRYLILDYTIMPALHTGFWYRGIDESYRSRSNLPTDYFRVTEGYLRGYFDYYFPTTKLVATVAVGHTVQRRYNYGMADDMITETYPEGAWMLQAGIALRFVTDPLFRTQRIP